MRTFALSITAAALALAAVPAVASPLRADVLVKDNFFKPKEVTIKKGGKVTWRWRGSNPHNVAIMKPGSSKVVKRSTVKTSGKYTSKFGSTGKWRIVCEIHPVRMRGRVIVKRR
jgi:plastocyanin